MYVSLRDKENSASKQRLSHLIEPVKMTQRSSRKVLEELFPQHENQSVSEEQAGKVQLPPDCGATRRTVVGWEPGEVAVEVGKVTGLVRELEQTRAIMRLQDTSKQRRICQLSERVKTLQQQLQTTQVHTRKYQQRCDVADRQLYDLQRRLIQKQMQVSAQFQHRILKLQSQLHQKEQELLGITTDNSKSKYDMHHELTTVREQTDRLRQMLAEKEVRLVEVETKAAIERAEMESRLEAMGRAVTDTQQQQLHKQAVTKEVTAQITSLSIELRTRQDTIRILKEQLNRLSTVESQNDELHRNQKKLVRRYAELERQMLQKNEKVNEIVLGYEDELAKAKAFQSTSQATITTLKKRNEELENELGRKSQQIIRLTMEMENFIRNKQQSVNRQETVAVEQSLSISIQTSRKQMQVTLKSMQEMRDRYHYQMNIKDEKIGWLDRQLIERDCEITRLNNLIKQTQTKTTRNDLLENESIALREQLQMAQTHNRSSSVQVELQMKTDQANQLGKILESQSLALQQVRKTLADNEAIIQLKNSQIAQISAQCRRLQNIVTQSQVLRIEEDQFRKQLISRFGGSLQSGSSAKQALLSKVAQLQSTKSLLNELTVTNRLLRQSNNKQTLQIQTLNHRVQELLSNQRLNEQLIIKIQEQSKASRERLQNTMQQQYELLYEKYIKYRRILQKDKDRKQMQRAIIRDSNEFNATIVEKCRQILK